MKTSLILVSFFVFINIKIRRFVLSTTTDLRYIPSSQRSPVSYATLPTYSLPLHAHAHAGAIKLFCKGADSAIRPRLLPSALANAPPILAAAERDLDAFSRIGLRTLWLAWRAVAEPEYVGEGGR
jgi:magnesium-transporting ATPase (P-type)